MDYMKDKNGQPVSAQERRRNHPSGHCPRCNATPGTWIAYADSEKYEYGVQCSKCKLAFPESD